MSKILPGYNIHRIKKEPRERVLWEEWVLLNPHGGGDTIIDCFKSPDGGLTKPPLTDDESVIVSTVIQWLGSPVGYGWLIETLKKADRAVVKAERRRRRQATGRGD